MTVQLYEELSMNAHSALQTQVYDGWVLRFANGYTGRANSIYALYPSALGLDEKIAECERRYFSRGRPTIFKITDATDPAIEKALAARGYEVVTPTFVMDMDLRERNFSVGDCVFSDRADEEFWAAYFSFRGYTDPANMQTAKQIAANAINPAVFARLVKNGATVACGFGVIERGFVGLLDISVDENRRREGHGTEICASLLSEAKRHGAVASYLQVLQENSAAVHLYEKIGYKKVYSYWYRVRKVL